MRNKFILNIFLGLALLLVAAAFSYFSQGFQLGYLDGLFLDLRGFLTAPKYPREDIISVSLSPLKGATEQGMSSGRLIEGIKKIQGMNPSKIILTLEIEEISDPEKFGSWIRNQRNIYLFSSWGREGALATDKRFKDLSNHILLKPTTDAALGPQDRKERRFVLSMDGKEIDQDLKRFNSAVPILDEHTWSDLPGVVTIFNSKQIFFRYYDMDSYPEVLINEIKIEDISGKIVVATTSDKLSPTRSHPYGRFKFMADQDDSTFFSYGKYILGIYANLKNLEYVRMPTLATNTAWIFLFMILNLGVFAALKDRPSRYLVVSVVVIPIEFFVCTMVFAMTHYAFDFTRILIGQLLIQYIGAPTLFIRYLRKVDAEKIELQKKTVRDRMKMNFSVKLAEADARMRVTAKVSHDLRSPLMALKIASQYLDGKIDIEVISMIQESVGRIRHIADDVLSEYKGKSNIATVETCNLVEVVAELLRSYKVVYPEVHLSSGLSGFIPTPLPYYALQRILANVVTNAIEAKACLVEIHAQIDDSGVTLFLCNDGPSIPPGIRDRIFDLDVTFGKKQGTGLGLYQVRTELQAYGGSIALSEDIKTSFVIRLPKEYNQLRITWSPLVLILTSNDKDTEAFHSLNGVKAKTCASVGECINALENLKPADVTIVVDLAFEVGESSAFDFLDSIWGREYAQVILYSLVVDSPDIQKVATHYGALLIEKGRLFNALKNEI